MQNSLVSKYNVPGPRYTSYPTVPYWNNADFSLSEWKKNIVQSFSESNSSEGISLYIHLPFCESLCTFCGCNKRITKNHSFETPYLESVLKEWRLYTEILPERPIIKELHLGGGTPTFFSAENLRLLLKGIFHDAKMAENPSFSFEGHPNNTKGEHLQTLFDCGFTRVSYGVQDYNPTVQIAIHRLQPFVNVKRVTETAREIGYTSVGHDIIFGLPFQKKEHVIYSIEKTKELMPDRIAFYSYAHVPWIKGNGQRGFKDEDLPSAAEKREMYETGKRMLEEAGYIEIGMDHFALKTDSLFKAVEDKKLHRNFMGYTESKTQLMLGLGVSAIGDSWYSFGQNVKNVEEYQDLVEQGILPVYRGHMLNEEDLIIRKHILNMMCRLETSWEDQSLQFKELPDALLKLKEMEDDGLVKIGATKLQITEKGRPFVRNICMAFDVLLKRNQPNTQLFSMTV
ncbi:oxygen-independent coproporphyrinogen III oxidase [Aequorivita antarctica]|uniref:Coproporphyrinogen-III oxidase n=1 Tax=Aequorivita antarctica TaxID=153266 RepID=A0A5C6YWT6_9FLAO|nr:oxygen-independent coproporphyrinogen III oxidase [Aequorivita antarctica]TXD71696.1 oxygen-independent coproporphyrinogen III oxidase [Aequorivita antarctica]SRX75803.1 Oxygen-independent coproporphyrinogen III oxidase [Aequorivita antarctica]